MSWKPVVTTNDGEVVQNAIRFATKGECDDYLKDLWSRWTAAHDIRAVECDQAVNYVWADGRAVYLENWQERLERAVYDRRPELLT